MSSEMYPWRQPKDLATVLSEVKPILAALGIVAPNAGCSDSEIAKAEARSQPFPPEVRAFFQSMRPTDLFSGSQKKEFGFYTIESDELTWKSMQGAEPAEDWVGAQGLFLGQSVFGDPFWWVKGHRSAPDGAIFLLDHEGDLTANVMFGCIARSFCEFLVKVVYFRKLTASQNAQFQAEYAELNPSAR